MLYSLEFNPFNEAVVTVLLKDFVLRGRNIGLVRTYQELGELFPRGSSVSEELAFLKWVRFEVFSCDVESVSIRRLKAVLHADVVQLRTLI